MRASIARMLLAALLGVLATGTTPARADVGATTGSATSITSTGATLNGIAVPSLPGSAWAFQYGTSLAYGQTTRQVALGSGVFALSAKVDHLAAATLYHYRLVLLRGSSAYALGRESSFTTAAVGPTTPVGHPSLISRRLTVSRGHVTVRFRCTGPARATCPGILAVSLLRRNQDKTTSVTCAGGPRVVGAAAAARPLTLPVASACLSALGAARQHHLPGSLVAWFVGQKAAMNVPVTLVLVR